MLRRFSTKIGISKDKKGETNGTANGISNGVSNGISHNTTNGVANGVSNDPFKPEKRPTFFSQRSKKETVDHNASRGDVESSFTQFAQLVHASRRPLPTQSGDGAYLDHTEPTGLLADIKSMGFKDAHTLMNVMKTKATGESQDDKTYLMEKTIQVCSYSSQLRDTNS